MRWSGTEGYEGKEIKGGERMDGGERGIKKWIEEKGGEG